MKHRVTPTVSILLFICIVASSLAFLPMRTSASVTNTALLDPTLIAYWKMEEGTGTTVIDSSGHGHNLYFANAPANPTWPTPTDVPTLIGGNSNSLAFDGVDDYAYAWPLAETVGSSQLTVETWVKFDAPLAGTAYTLASAQNGGIATQWELNSKINEVQAVIYSSCCSGLASGETVGVNLQPGQWYHIAFVYDGSQATNAERLRIYVNGTAYPVIYGYNRTIPATLSNDQPVVRLGPTSNVPATAPLNGKLDEVRIYTVARSSTDVANDAAGQTASTNTAPDVVADNTSVVKGEGGTATNTGTYSDANASDDVTISASVGTVTKTGTSSGTWNWSFSTTDGPAQSQIVTISADDGNGEVSTTTFSLTVNNIEPTAIFTNTPNTLVKGESATLAFNNQFDPGAADTAAGFLYSYDCTNDGIFELADSTAASYACPYPDDGTFTARGFIKDKDGGFTSYTVTVTVLAPQQAIEVIGDDVQGLVDTGALNQGQGNALMNKLDQAINKLDQGKITQAINHLQAFINQVNDFINTGVLTPAEGQPLIDAANRIIAVLSG